MPTISVDKYRLYEALGQKCECPSLLTPTMSSPTSRPTSTYVSLTEFLRLEQIHDRGV
jgi:hypothetical protein